MGQNDLIEHKAQMALSSGKNDEVIKLLMDEYGNHIYPFCKQMVGAKEAAEDILQTTFVQAYQGLSAFKADSSFKTWLFAIAKNRCLDYLKAERRREKRVEFTDEVEKINQESSIEMESNQEYKYDQKTKHIIDDCLKKLPAITQSALLFRFTFDMTLPEIAKVLDEKSGTVQARIARSLPSLKDCVEKNGVTL